MSEAQQQQTITKRQIAASQVGAVFNSLHEYLRTLEPKDAEGRSTLTQQLVFAHCRIDEAAMWAIKSVLTYGLPPKPTPPATESAATESAATESAATESAAPAAETPAPIGVVDPPQALPDNAPTGADALPPTTPQESV